MTGYPPEPPAGRPPPSPGDRRGRRAPRPDEPAGEWPGGPHRRYPGDQPGNGHRAPAAAYPANGAPPPPAGHPPETGHPPAPGHPSGAGPAPGGYPGYPDAGGPAESPARPYVSDPRAPGQVPPTDRARGDRRRPRGGQADELPPESFPYGEPPADPYGEPPAEPRPRPRGQNPGRR